MQKLLERDAKHPKLAEFAELLYDQALLTAGLPVADPLRFAQRVSTLMAEQSKTLIEPPKAKPSDTAKPGKKKADAAD